jgi:transposase
MPATHRAVLSPLEEEMLSELRVATNVPQRTRDRAHILRLNAQGWSTTAIADVFDCHEHTVRKTVKRWNEKGLAGLWEASGRGAKRRWSEEDIAYLDTCLKEETRTYNSAQVAKTLKDDHNVSLSDAHLRKILKKKLSMETNPSQPSKKAKSNRTRD